MHDGSSAIVIQKAAHAAKRCMIPLSAAMIADLENWWRQHRHPRFLFPGFGYAWKSIQRRDGAAQAIEAAAVMRAATEPMGESTLQFTWRKVVLESGINKKITLHTLRHTYATHLLEEGVAIRLISQYLGHATIEQTMVYTHLTVVSEEATQRALIKLGASLRGGSCATGPHVGDRCPHCGQQVERLGPER